jgi:hypothetical protein
VRRIARLGIIRDEYRLGDPRAWRTPIPTAAFTLRNADRSGLSGPPAGPAGADAYEIVATSQRITVLAVLKMSNATCSWRVTRNNCRLKTADAKHGQEHIEPFIDSVVVGVRALAGR